MDSERNLRRKLYIAKKNMQQFIENTNYLLRALRQAEKVDAAAQRRAKRYHPRFRRGRWLAQGGESRGRGGHRGGGRSHGQDRNHGSPQGRDREARNDQPSETQVTQEPTGGSGSKEIQPDDNSSQLVTQPEMPSAAPKPSNQTK